LSDGVAASKTSLGSRFCITRSSSDVLFSTFNVLGSSVKGEKVSAGGIEGAELRDGARFVEMCYVAEIGIFEFAMSLFCDVLVACIRSGFALVTCARSVLKH
jgi:hypothetical protein